MLYWALFMIGLGWWVWCGCCAIEEFQEWHRPRVMSTWTVLALPAAYLTVWAAVHT